jgi:hypothetical protein
MALESVFVTEARGRKINDEALHLAKMSHWLPLLKCVVQRMLKNEFPDEYLPYLQEDGSIVDRARKRPE